MRSRQRRHNIGTTRIGADFGSLHSRLGTSLRSAPLRAEPSAAASKIGPPPLPHHFNLERSALINYPFNRTPPL